MRRLEDLILREGFSELTVDRMCQKLRCSKSSLYLIAPTREKVIETVTRHFFAETTAAVERALTEEEDPSKRMLQYLDGIGVAMRRNSARFYADMLQYAPTARIYKLNTDAAAHRVRGLIEEGVTAGVFRENDSVFAGHAIAMLINGMRSGELLEATGLSAGEAISEVGEIFVNGLRAR
jgi:AcrR family transcriptional regulator